MIEQRLEVDSQPSQLSCPFCQQSNCLHHVSAFDINILKEAWWQCDSCNRDLKLHIDYVARQFIWNAKSETKVISF